MGYKLNVEASAEHIKPVSDPSKQALGRFEDEYLDYIAQAKPAAPSFSARREDETRDSGQAVPRPVDQSSNRRDGSNQHLDIWPFKPLDSTRPTLVIFDSFTCPVAAPNGDADPALTHGQISADAAEQRGYNVVRVSSKNGGPDFGKTMPDLADRIENGEIPVGRGDVLNVSAGWSVSFEKASRLLGLNISAENVREMVPQIRQRLRELSNDPSLSEKDRNWLKEMTASNDAVERIRGRGVEVVVSAGNEGKEEFNIALLTATTQLAATNAGGEVASWSSNNSLTTLAQRHFEPRYRAVDLIGSPVRPGAHPLPRELFQGSGGHEAGTFAAAPAPDHLTTVRTRAANGDNVGLPPYLYDKYIVGWTRGTSFSNVDYLSSNFERLRKLKMST
jgi:hypothetical protein